MYKLVSFVRLTVAGISRTIRDLPPAHYLFEIKSFSSLLKQEGEKHESDSFEAGGFKWCVSMIVSTVG